MSYGFLDIATTPSVRAVQAQMGSDQIWEGREHDRDFNRFTVSEAEFISRRDSFYMASVSETGWPYVQHRGGPEGFLKLVDDRTLAFADYRGNRQYISARQHCRRWPHLSLPGRLSAPRAAEDFCACADARRRCRPGADRTRHRAGLSRQDRARVSI